MSNMSISYPVYEFLLLTILFQSLLKKKIIHYVVCTKMYISSFIAMLTDNLRKIYYLRHVTASVHITLDKPIQDIISHPGALLNL